MTLSQLLKDIFRGDVQFRGMQYLKNEQVKLTRITSEDIHGIVQDGRDYQTHLQRDDHELRMSCTCRPDSNVDVLCKHVWGTILAVDHAKILPSSIKPGYLPPFAVESEGLRPDEIDWDEDDLEIPVRELTQMRSTVAHAPPTIQSRMWEERLGKLRESLSSRDPSRSSELREREIFYEIDLSLSREQGVLVIETSQRQRRGNGGWGKLKSLRVRSNTLNEFEGADRQILSCLCGGGQERAAWNAGFDGGSPARFLLSYPLADLLLPQLCATRRLRYRHQSDDDMLASLEWDPGEAWELGLRLSENHEQKEWELTGELIREGDKIPLTETLLVLPGGFIFRHGIISRLRDRQSCDWIELLGKQEPVTIPEGDEEEFVDRLLDMPNLPSLELPAHLKLREIHSTPVPHLVLYSPRGVRWQKERLHGDVLFEYRGELIRANSPQGALVQREQGYFIARNREEERQFQSQLDSAGFHHVEDSAKTRWDVEIIPRELGRAVRQLIPFGWQIRAEGKQILEPGALQFQVRSHIDWFELHAEVDFAGQRVPFPELLAALARGESTVRLDDGSLGLLPEEWFHQYGMLANLGIAEEDHVRFSKNQVGILDALLATQQNVDFDITFRELRDRLQNFTGITPADEPAGFGGTLRAYQREGVGWLEFLKQFDFGGCLADDMGLGKTIQLLALLLEHHRNRKDKKASLVVVPKSLIFNWLKECRSFTPQLNVLEYTGLERAKLRNEFQNADLILTTYGTLRRDVLLLREIEFEYVVLDEAQAIKNSRSQVAKAVRLLRSRHRLALSGTPIENHLGDLWSIFEFLNPGMLGRASLFKSDSDFNNAETRVMLAKALRPFILRRSKIQVADELPDKVEQTIFCKMGEQQLRLYEELRDHYRQSLLGMIRREGMAKSKIHVLEALLRLRQACCHPGLLDKSHEDETGAKLDVLLLQLEELLSEGHKALVFSQFTSMLAIVKKHLDKKGIVYEYLDGQTRKRKEHVERFQNDPECGVFLISLKAGGLGLNLTAADYVFILDPWWNPAVEAQAIDRAHRIGQQRHVFAYRLICRDTVEEKIAALQEHKRELAEAILQEDNNLLKDLSLEDLTLLFS